jgi:carbonic anhydrase
MSTIDYIFRYDTKDSAIPRPTADGASARKALEDGNRVFASWMDSCRKSNVSEDALEYVVPCMDHQLALKHESGQIIKQAPFAAVVGCSDARVPTELLFGQGFNNLFIVRVAGNVLGDACVGSIDYSLHALAHSLKCVVVLGHLGCGAVAATVDAYLEPHALWTKAASPFLRSIIQRIVLAVREADHGIEHVWGAKAREMPGYRSALSDIAVCVNAAQVALDLRVEVERTANPIDVFYGVFNLNNYQVTMPVDPLAPFSLRNGNLADAPAGPEEFHRLAVRMAEMLKGRSAEPESHAHSHGGDGAVRREAKAAAKRDSLILQHDDHLGLERST